MVKQKVAMEEEERKQEREVKMGRKLSRKQ